MTKYRHAVRADTDVTRALRASANLAASANGPVGHHTLEFSAAVFLHAYSLLGMYPQRFGTDLSLYLATVNAFLGSAAGSHEYISLSGVTATDARRRLSEDLGVALSALFMVEGFDLTWETIAQIPLNKKLRTKRPDFEGFDRSGSRFLFEAKGTTAISSVERVLYKALDQVKLYPEAASSKYAIVSFLSTDDRLFQSQTFVVDPPAMPDEVPATKEFATLLHAEKILEYADLPQTAAAFLRDLPGEFDRTRSRVSDWDTRSVRSVYAREIASRERATREIRGETYEGRVIQLPPLRRSLFLGVLPAILDAFLRREPPPPLATLPPLQYDENVSVFSDGTCLTIE